MKNTAILLLALFCASTAMSQPPGRYDIVITEIMANPSTATSLPDARYIELYNRSQQTFDLKGWAIGDGNQTARINHSYLLQPDSFIVLSSTSGSTALSVITTTIGIPGFPPLRVNGDLIVLQSAEGITVHALNYKREWFNNVVKSAGGWSLEMIDTGNPCSANNWSASVAGAGGSPGMINSVHAANPDHEAPFIFNVSADDSLQLTVRFNEPLDSISASLVQTYAFNNMQPLRAEPLAPTFESVRLSLQNAMKRGAVYSLVVKDLHDCSGNSAGTLTAYTGLPSAITAQDVVINEILFNPPPDGADYIELYNKSQNILDLGDLFISNRTNAGNIGPLKKISLFNRAFLPGSYVVLTEDSAILKKQYTVKDLTAVVPVPSLPPMPNERGTILLFNKLGETIDELSYEEIWHFPLIVNPKGVALERVEAQSPSQNEKNWHSAATSAGFGTPGYQNSQYVATQIMGGRFTVFPKLFSPDNDGVDDFTTIQYAFEQTDNVCSIFIFDSRGGLVRKLVQNALCAREGYFRWDGLGENKQQLPLGVYILSVECYTLNGKKLKEKKAVTLARRF